MLSAGLGCAHCSTCLPPKSPKSPPVLGGSVIARRTPGTQCIAALMTRVCYSKGMLSKISEGKRYIGQSLEEARGKQPLPVKSPDALNPSALACDSTCEVSSSAEAH